MTGFFALSGFVLYYNYCAADFNDINEIGVFLKKRVIAIYPIYALIWVVYFYYLFNTSPIRDDITAFPMQFFLVFGAGYYNYLVNTGVWFFSCIFICYLVFPYLCIIIRKLNEKQLIILATVIYLINSFMPLKVDGCYYSAFCRILELSVGMIAAKMFTVKNVSISKAVVALSVAAVLIIDFLLEKINLFSMAWNQERMNFF